jgi:hypothetical protein
LSTAVHLRPDLDLTLAAMEADLASGVSGTQIQDVPTGQIEFHLNSAQPTISLGTATGTVEVPATENSVVAFGDLLGVPTPFLKRLGKEVGKDTQEALLSAMLAASPMSAMAVRYGEGGVSGVFEPGKEPFNPVRLVEIASRVLGERGVVQRRYDSGAEFGFDVHVPLNSEVGIFDSGVEVEAPEALATYSWTTHQQVAQGAQVRDITAGGLRFGVDLKRGLTPWVQPFMLRLACTNGMETTDPGLRVDGRGLSVDEVLADLEAQAQRAFSRVEQQMEHFYNLRNQPVDNPERALVRLAAERNLPQRSLRALLDSAPSEALPDRPSMFDVTNLITNLANSPSVRNDGGRLLLERAGGAIVVDEAARCGHCQQKVI